MLLYTVPKSLFVVYSIIAMHVFYAKRIKIEDSLRKNMNGFLRSLIIFHMVDSHIMYLVYLYAQCDDRLVIIQIVLDHKRETHALIHDDLTGNLEVSW